MQQVELQISLGILILIEPFRFLRVRDFWDLPDMTSPMPDRRFDRFLHTASTGIEDPMSLFKTYSA